MHTLLVIAMVLVGVLASGLVLVLLVPIHVTARGVCTAREVDALACVSWGGGVASVLAQPATGVHLRLFGRPVYRVRASTGAEEEPQVVEPKKKRKKRSRAPMTFRQAVRFGWRTLRRVGPSLRLRARLAGRLGTGDPADTATLWGAMSVCRAALPRLDTTGLTVDWIEPALDLEGQLDGRIWPAAIVWIVTTEFVTARWTTRGRRNDGGYREALRERRPEAGDAREVQRRGGGAGVGRRPTRDPARGAHA